MVTSRQGTPASSGPSADSVALPAILRGGSSRLVSERETPDDVATAADRDSTDHEDEDADTRMERYLRYFLALCDPTCSLIPRVGDELAVDPNSRAETGFTLVYVRKFRTWQTFCVPSKSGGQKRFILGDTGDWDDGLKVVIQHDQVADAIRQRRFIPQNVRDSEHTVKCDVLRSEAFKVRVTNRRLTYNTGQVLIYGEIID